MARGWKGQRKRHAAAATKGWEKRRSLLSRPSGEVYKALTRDLPAKYGGPDPHAEFERGDIRRAVRDIAAKHIAGQFLEYAKLRGVKHDLDTGVIQPYALATEQVKQNVKFAGGTLSRRRTIQRQVAREYIAQSKKVGKEVSMKDAMRAAGRWVAS